MTRMVLYQKYRPKKLSQLVNQKPIKETLLSALKNNQVGHAYLFSGPRGTGKTSVARILARAMNCQKSQQVEPCGKCQSCQEGEKNNFVDLIETDAASNRGIDQIRELKEKIKFSPIASKYKIYIIDEVHMLTREAFNALLKMLEEPPKHAIFILATTEPHKIPETVLSRCQKFNFKPLSIKDISRHLAKISRKEKYSIDKQAILMISAAASGSLRDALGILEQICSSSTRKVDSDRVSQVLGLVENRALIKLVDLLIKKNLSQAIDLITKLINQGIEPSRLIDSINEYLRQLLLIKLEVDSERLNLSKEEYKKSVLQTKTVSKPKVRNWIEIFLSAKNQSSPNLPQLPLELAITEIIGFERRDKTKGKSVSKPEIKPSAGEKVDLSEAKENWPQVIKKVNSDSHSLSGILSHCQIVGAESGRLILATDRAFYQKRIMDLANRKKIEKIITTILGKQCQVDCRVDKTIVQKEEKKDEKKESNLEKLAHKAEQIFNG